MSTQDWMRLVLVVVLLLALGARLLTLAGRYRRGGAGDRRMIAQARARQRSVAELAAGRGWTVVQGDPAQRDAAQGATFDPSLSAAGVDVGTRDFSVSGPGFRADSWMAYTGRAGSALRYSFRLAAVHVAAAGDREPAAFGVLPLPRQPMLFPASLRGQVVESAGAVAMAGAVAPVLPALTGLLPEIERLRVWLVVRPDEVVVLADRELTADDLLQWLDLGARARDAVASALG